MLDGDMDNKILERPKEKLWWTTKEVAYELGVKTRVIYRLAKGRMLPCVKVGGQWRFKVVDIQKWVAEGGCDKWL